MRLKSGNSNQQPTVSIVVAARNESANIIQCLDSLENQDYPAEKLEIIMVDDRSEDDTAALLKNRNKNNPRLKVIQIKELAPDFSPKKWALTQGIQAATGEIIFTTDADCRPVPTWISTMVRYFEPEIGLVAGFSPLENLETHQGIGKKLFALDSLSLACVAAGGIGLGVSLTCSGRNLAYRRQVWEEVGGFIKIKKLVSGDDDLLLHLVMQETNWKTNYALNPKTLVYSNPPQTFHAFAMQRIRHASKGKHYSAKHKFILVLVYFYNVCLLIGGSIFPFISVKLWLFGLLSLILKSLMEFRLLWEGANKFQKNFYLRLFPLAVFFHIPYIVIFGLLGTFKNFRWKGQAFRAKTSPS
ncbi:glycosyltransferase [candidate division KSB1 bacterium]|nr:glycosyltransferase [candidate division KSB1 bacterium]